MNPISTSNAEHYIWGGDCDGWQESAAWPACEVGLHAGAGPREMGLERYARLLVRAGETVLGPFVTPSAPDGAHTTRSAWVQCPPNAGSAPNLGEELLRLPGRNVSV